MSGTPFGNGRSAAILMRDFRDRRLTSEEIAQRCLDRIAERDAALRAFTFVDADAVLRQARQRDREEPLSPLHGLPVAVKDVIDVRGLPTSYGSPIYEGHIPDKDAACITRLKQAGCVVLGKTATAEFAWVTPPATRNPHNEAHTPGGSSSGSAASVGAGMAPLALGTQTGGSVIRPSAYCGIVGFKPSFGRHDFTGIKHLAPSYDTLGFHAAGVDDVALLDAVLTDPFSPYEPLPQAQPISMALCRTPAWNSAEFAQQETVLETAEMLRSTGVTMTEVDLPRSLERFSDFTNTLLLAEARASLDWEYSNRRPQLSGMTQELLEQAFRLTRHEIDEARNAHRQILKDGRAFLAEHGTLLTASAPGEPPEGIASTGSSSFNRLWTALWLPCLTLPAGAGQNDLPLGVQLIGRYREDERLLSFAAYVEELLHGIQI